jgi:hypothetical protein
VASPAARFLQWKTTLTAGAEGRSPELESVDVAYLSKNLAPRVEQIEITPANYKFPAPVTPQAGRPQPQSLNLPPLGKRTTPATRAQPGFAGQHQHAVDAMGQGMDRRALGGVRPEWRFPDLHGRNPRGSRNRVEAAQAEGRGEVLRRGIPRLFRTANTAFASTASDAPSNPPADALTGQLVSDAFTVDNTPPRISGLSATRNGGKLDVRWHAADALSNIAKAEYSLDGGDWTVAAPVTKLSDSLSSTTRWSSMPRPASTPSPSAWKTTAPTRRRIRLS